MNLGNAALGEDTCPRLVRVLAVADDVVEHLVGCVNHTRRFLQWRSGEAESAFRYDGVSTEHRRDVEHGDARAAHGRLECRG